MKAQDPHRFFVYHSPQYPGFTCWCGLWAMPDGSAMCSFTQATGPFAGRPRAPTAVRHLLDWPPAGHSEAYDMTGLRLENVHVRSRDGGDSWRVEASNTFRSCMNGATGEAETALPDGTLLRGVWGRYLPYDDVLQDGYIERSTDAGRTWRGPERINTDPQHTFWPKRLRRLRDGRVLVGGGLYRLHPECDNRERWTQDFLPALFVSADGSPPWRGPIPVVPEAQRRTWALTEELDWAELDDGRLLVVLRAGVQEGRLQTRLVPHADAWRTAELEPAGLPYSGHPELLRTRDGSVLHVATTGISVTRNGGRAWADVELCDGLSELRQERTTPYYPKAVELSDSRIMVVGHVGGDDGYGCVDQSVIGLRFTLPRG